MCSGVSMPTHASTEHPMAENAFASSADASALENASTHFVFGTAKFLDAFARERKPRMRPELRTHPDLRAHPDAQDAFPFTYGGHPPNSFTGTPMGPELVLDTLV